MVEGYPDIVVWAEDGVAQEGLCSTVLQLEDKDLVCVVCVKTLVYQSNY